jgi:hypothetical protein
LRASEPAAEILSEALVAEPKDLFLTWLGLTLIEFPCYVQ